MNSIASGIIVLVFVFLFGADIQRGNTSREQKLKYKIQTTNFWDIPDYTNEYKIDSLGCIHFTNQDTVEMIICDTYIIQPFK